MRVVEEGVVIHQYACGQVIGRKRPHAHAVAIAAPAEYIVVAMVLAYEGSSRIFALIEVGASAVADSNRVILTRPVEEVARAKGAVPERGADVYPAMDRPGFDVPARLGHPALS
jgi:hypothetical protein